MSLRFGLLQTIPVVCQYPERQIKNKKIKCNSFPAKFTQPVFFLNKFKLANFRGRLPSLSCADRTSGYTVQMCINILTRVHVGTEFFLLF